MIKIKIIEDNLLLELAVVAAVGFAVWLVIVNGDVEWSYVHLSPTILLIVNLEIILLIVPIPTLLFKIVNPETFNDDVHVKVLFIIVVPDTYNELFIVVLFDNVVKPDIFNDDIHVILCVPLVNKAPLNTAGNLTVLSVDVQSIRPVGLNDIMGFVVFCINLVLSAINNKRVFSLLAPNTSAIPSVLVWNGTKYSWPDN